MRPVGRIVPALLLLALPAACGGRTVPLFAVSGDTPDDGGADADTGADATSDAVVRDSSPVISCVPHTGQCTDTVQCCNAEPCNAGFCGSPPMCGKTGAVCLRNEDCCQDDCYGGFCGQPPGCLEDGARCTNGPTCCGGLCLDGACTCSSDGSACTHPSECCSSQCTSQRCGVNRCEPLGASGCDICVARYCCPQVSACELEPTCHTYLLCISDCESNGGTTVSCEQSQCGSLSDPLATQVVRCTENKCGSDCDAG